MLRAGQGKAQWKPTPKFLRLMFTAEPSQFNTSHRAAATSHFVQQAFLIGCAIRKALSILSIVQTPAV
jgi:hypothetical protein